MKEFEFLKAELDKMKENKTWQQMKQIETKQIHRWKSKGKRDTAFIEQLSRFDVASETCRSGQTRRGRIRSGYGVRPYNRRNIHNAQ